jgi:hypothetical protein
MSVKEFQSNVSQDVSSGKEKKHLRQRDFEDRLTILLKLASLEEVSQAEAFELPGPPPALSDASLEQGDPSAPGVTSRVERREEQNRRTVAVFRAFQQLSKRRRDQVAAAITIDGTVFEFRESEDADVSPNGLCSEDFYWFALELRRLFSRMADVPREPDSHGAKIAGSRSRIGPIWVFDSYLVDGNGLLDTNATIWGRVRDLVHQIEVARIKRCPMCEKFFYARRKEKAACSNCLNAWNQKLHRKRSPGYQKNRKRNKRARAATESRLDEKGTVK